MKSSHMTYGRIIAPRSARQTQIFLPDHDQINEMFRPGRYRISTVSYRHERSDAFDLCYGYAFETTC